jgi:NADPH:quinone reductase-like Zn-dependent oxidoreductase
VRVMTVNNAKQEPMLIASAFPQPQPAEGELLIRVRATGVMPTELVWYPTTHTKEGGARTRVALGNEFSGIIAAVGRGADGFNVGDEIYA